MTASMVIFSPNPMSTLQEVTCFDIQKLHESNITVDLEDYAFNRFRISLLLLSSEEDILNSKSTCTTSKDSIPRFFAYSSNFS